MPMPTPETTRRTRVVQTATRRARGMGGRSRRGRRVTGIESVESKRSPGGREGRTVWDSTWGTWAVWVKDRRWEVSVGKRLRWLATGVAVTGPVTGPPVRGLRATEVVAPRGTGMMGTATTGTVA